ncbi:MAG: aminotransferase class IV [Candidatus Marsarchaeota archaeon]|nr:aminotransferase class IV [Candidatus Marsarchaeota archaeon]
MASKSSDILIGITRDSVIKLAEAVGLEVEERDVNREELYTCSEAFFSGTAAEITPITSIDFRKIGKGSAGPITKTIAEDYSAATTGMLNEGFEDWLTYI